MTARRPTAPRTGHGPGADAPRAEARPAPRPAARPTASGKAATPRAPSGKAATARPTSGRAPAGKPGSPRGGEVPASRTRPARNGSTPRTPGASRPATADAPGSRRAIALGGGGDDGAPAPAISLRMLVIFLVALVAFVVLAPTLRYAVAQQEQLRSLNAEVADARARNTELERQLELWQDPQYVQAQARDRLGYVMPGETPYIVVDPEIVTGGESEADAEAAERAAARAAATPWYLRVAESVQVAGESDAGGEDPSGLTVPESEN